MSFYISPGELRTKIRIQKQIKIGTGSFATTEWVDLGNTASVDTPRYVMAKWFAKIVGSQTELSASTQSLDFATVTIRYNSEISEMCQIVKDSIAYQIMNISDPNQHKQWQEIYVKAAVNS